MWVPLGEETGGKPETALLSIRSPYIPKAPHVFCLACLLPPAIWTRFCSATYFIGILGVINQQIEVKLITYDLSIKLRAM